MRVDPNLSSILNAGIQGTAQSLQTAVQQLSSGQRVALPSDDPYAAAANLRSLAESSNVDRYTSNSEAVLSQAHMADSALSSVVGELTQAVSLGTEGANGTSSSADRTAIATQVQGLLAQVVSAANTQVNGVGLFTGTAGVSAAFVPDSTAPAGYTYQGNSGVNQAAIGDALAVSTNIPGDQIFTSASANVLGSLSGLVSALHSGDTSAIAAATGAISSAIAYVSQQRVLYAGTMNQIQAQESFLSQETVSLQAQQQGLTGVDTTAAISALTQAQTAHSAVLAVAAKVLPTSLLDYLK